MLPLLLLCSRSCRPLGTSLLKLPPIERQLIQRRLQQLSTTHWCSSSSGTWSRTTFPSSKSPQQVKLSSGGKLSMWLGRSADTLNPEMRAETDALIAAYLDRFAAHSPRALGSAQTSAAALASAGCAASTAEASANSATGSSTDHATIVQRLRQHLMAHGMRQVDVAARAGISSSKLSMWMSAKSKMYFTPGGATEEGSDCAREVSVVLYIVYCI